MGNVSIRNVKFKGGKDKQQKFEAQLSKFQGFKGSHLRRQSNMGISTFEMLASEIPSVECKDKERKFEVKVSK